MTRAAHRTPLNTHSRGLLTVWPSHIDSLCLTRKTHKTDNCLSFSVCVTAAAACPITDPLCQCSSASHFTEETLLASIATRTGCAAHMACHSSPAVALSGVCNSQHLLPCDAFRPFRGEARLMIETHWIEANVPHPSRWPSLTWQRSENFGRAVGLLLPTYILTWSSQIDKGLEKKKKTLHMNFEQHTTPLRPPH